IRARVRRPAEDRRRGRGQGLDRRQIRATRTPLRGRPVRHQRRPGHPGPQRPQDHHVAHRARRGGPVMSAAEFPSTSEAVSQETIDRYADISGDYNPIHVDQEAAAASEFGGTIAHGPIALQTFFRSLTEATGGGALPPGTEVKVTFRAPVRPGDTVRSELRE